MVETECLIIGGGPTGLGAAWRFEEKGSDWLLLETENYFGGLASSFVDEKGFTWDLGGHVQFSHYETFDRYMRQALGEDGWYTHERESWVWLKNRFIPYPFQNNLHRLDAEDRWRCVEGLLHVYEQQMDSSMASASPENFEEWMLATFGEGITDLFMRPYNFKVWAHPPRTMSYGWIGERVSVPGLQGVLQSICTGEDSVSWGPNATFLFPRKGGTGAIWESLGRQLPAERCALGAEAAQIDVAAKTVRTSSGDTYHYKHLVTTMPLDKLIRMASGVVPEEKADEFVFSATNMVGVGVEGNPPEHLKTKCWMYFPESHNPYYRVTVFTNYSPANAPLPGKQWSLMTETAESPAKHVDVDKLVDDTVAALIADQLLSPSDVILSTEHRRLAQAYPTPFLGRDELVDPILRAFETQDIYSRGRFGAWKYEVANQDHSFAQGYECAERLTSGGDASCEPTLFTPRVVNSRKNP